MISALPSIPLAIGAHRVVRGVRVERLGDPSLSREQGRALMLRIARTALRALGTTLDRPTLFEPTETAPEPTDAARSRCVPGPGGALRKASEHDRHLVVGDR